MAYGKSNLESVENRSKPRRRVCITGNESLNVFENASFIAIESQKAQIVSLKSIFCDGQTLGLTGSLCNAIGMNDSEPLNQLHFVRTSILFRVLQIIFLSSLSKHYEVYIGYLLTIRKILQIPHL